MFHPLSTHPLPPHPPFAASPVASEARMSDRLHREPPQVKMTARMNSLPQSFTPYGDARASDVSHSSPASTHTVSSSSSSGRLAMLDRTPVTLGHNEALPWVSVSLLPPGPPIYTSWLPPPIMEKASDLLYLLQQRGCGHGPPTPTFPVSRTER